MKDEPNDFTCQDLVELVTDYLEGSLEPELRHGFEQHLAECVGCQTYLGQMRRTILLLGKPSAAQLTEEECNELLTLFRSWRGA